MRRAPTYLKSREHRPPPSVNNSGRSQVVIYISKVNYICPADLDILLSLCEGVMEIGKRIVISGAANSVCETLDSDICGSLFDIR